MIFSKLRKTNLILIYFLSILILKLSIGQQETDKLSKTSIDIQLLAKITYDLLYQEKKKEIFNNNGMDLVSGLNFFFDQLKKVQEDKILYKEYQNALHNIVFLRKKKD